MANLISKQRISPFLRESFKYKWGRQGLWLAIKRRRDIRRVDSRVNLADGRRITDSEALSQLAARVSGLLERCDAFLTRRAGWSKIGQQELLAYLTDMEAEIAALKQ